MTEDELKEVYAQIIVMWQLIKKYSAVKDEEPFWDDCIKEVSALESQGVVGDHLGQAVLRILEHFYRKKREKIEKIYTDDP